MPTPVYLEQMGARRQTARTASNNTQVAGKVFFHNGYGGNVSGMRQAAKRFVETPEFDNRATYYDAELVDGRYKFTAILPLSARK